MWADSRGALLPAGCARCSYTNWTYGSAQQCDDFFSDRTAINLYKNHVKAVLTRKNSLNGFTYGSDPTIFGAAPSFPSTFVGLLSCRCCRALPRCLGRLVAGLQSLQAWQLSKPPAKKCLQPAVRVSCMLQASIAQLSFR
jgi:hypothetical protein